MVIGKGIRNGREFVLIGLSLENVERMKKGQPIRITPETHPVTPSNMDILILYGETEQDIVKQLEGEGVIGDDTEIRL